MDSSYPSLANYPRRDTAATLLARKGNIATMTDGIPSRSFDGINICPFLLLAMLLCSSLH